MLYQYILEDAAFNYTIHLKLQTGESSSALDEHTDFRFSTKDHNDGNRDPNCAQDYTGTCDRKQTFSLSVFVLN